MIDQLPSACRSPRHTSRLCNFDVALSKTGRRPFRTSVLDCLQSVYVPLSWAVTPSLGDRRADRCLVAANSRDKGFQFWAGRRLCFREPIASDPCDLLRIVDANPSARSNAFVSSLQPWIASGLSCSAGLRFSRRRTHSSESCFAVRNGTGKDLGALIRFRGFLAGARRFVT